MTAYRKTCCHSAFAGMSFSLRTLPTYAVFFLCLFGVTETVDAQPDATTSDFDELNWTMWHHRLLRWRLGLWLCLRLTGIGRTTTSTWLRLRWRRLGLCLRLRNMFPCTSSTRPNVVTAGGLQVDKDSIYVFMNATTVGVHLNVNAHATITGVSGCK